MNKIYPVFGLVVVLMAVSLFVTTSVYALPFGQNKVNYTFFDWKIHSTTHFNIYYYQGLANRVPEVAEVAEGAYSKISKDLDMDLKNPVPLILYKVRREFEQTNVIPQFIPRGVAAFSELFRRRVVVPVDGPRTQLHKTIVHEIVHIFQYDILFHSFFSELSPAPQWLMEGYAEHESEDWDSIGKMVLRDAVLNGYIYSMDQLDTFNVSNVYLAYKQSQSLVDFIISKKGKRALRDIFYRLGKKSDKTSEMDEILKSVLGWNQKELHHFWSIYLKKEFYPLITIEPEPEDTLQPLTMGDAYTADMNPLYSPTGEMIAFISNRKRGHKRIDNIYLAKSDKGSILKCLTDGMYLNRYDYIQTEGRPLSWSPDGNHIAFIGRKDTGSALFVLDIRTSNIYREFMLDANQATSPCFSPDGTEIAFTGYLDGQSDIFLLNLPTGNVRQITYDPFIDETPVFDSTGRNIFYSTERGEHYRIYRFSLDNLQKKYPVTTGDWDDKTPVLCTNDSVMLYSSDMNGIYNLYAMNMDTGNIARLTNTIGGYFNPACSPDNSRILFMGFYKNQNRIYKLDFPDIEKTERITPQPQPSLRLSEPVPAVKETGPTQLIKGEKVKFKLYPDILRGGVAYVSSGVFITQATIAFSDMFNDHELFFTSYTFNRDQSYLFQYSYMKRRTDYFFNFYNLRYYDFGFEDPIEKSEFGTAFGIRYPINRYRRIDFMFDILRRDFERDEQFTVQNPDFFDDRKILRGSLSFITDKTRFSYFGPVSGYRYNLSIEQSIGVTDSFASFTNFYIDYRNYLQLSDRSLLASRVSLASSHGRDREIFFIGGAGTIVVNPFGTIRGFDVGEIAGPSTLALNLELRFPLIDLILFSPGITMGGIRGKLFLDTGFANIEDVNLLDDVKGSRLLNDDKIINISSVGAGISWNLGWTSLNFDFAKVTDFERFYGDSIFQFWIGREF